MLQAKGIYKRYQQRQVLKGVSMEVFGGEMLAIVGASGAGKSTLLQIMGTLDQPDEGEVIFQGEVIHRLAKQKLAAFRNKRLGFVFQHHNLLPEFSAEENIWMPALISGEAIEQVKARAKDLMERLGLAQIAGQKPSQLSGGEQQRVAIARALINQPDLLLADEPTGNLDQKNASALHELLLELRKTYQQTIVVVTHNQELARLADRKMTMSEGVLIEH
jgi:lipoprotein-releasing system ATP-binding protein